MQSTEKIERSTESIEELIIEIQVINEQRVRSNSLEPQPHEVINKTSLCILTGSAEKTESDIRPIITNIPTIQSPLPSAIQQMSSDGINSVKEEKRIKRRSNSFNKMNILSKNKEPKKTTTNELTIQMNQLSLENPPPNEQLLLLIEKNENNFWAKLSLAGEKMIPCTTLFPLIKQQIELLIQESPYRFKIIRYQMFCTSWLQKNKGSLLIEKASPHIQQIIELTTEYSDSNKLSEILQKARTDRPIANKMRISIASTIYGFTGILNDALEGTEKSTNYKKAVKMVVNDLQCRQVELYCNITPSDFFSEHYEPCLDAIKVYTEHFNRLSSYVIETIFLQHDFKKRVLLVKFFIDIAAKCFERKDYASGTAIGMSITLLNRAFDKIKSTFTQVSKTSSYQSTLEHFKILFTDKNNCGELRSGLKELLTTEKPYIPYLGLYLKDIEFLVEQSKKMNPMYDVESLTSIDTTIQNALAGQSKWHLSSTKISYTTDLVKEHLDRHTPLDMDAQHTLSLNIPDSPKSKNQADKI